MDERMNGWVGGRMGGWAGGRVLGVNGRVSNWCLDAHRSESHHPASYRTAKMTVRFPSIGRTDLGSCP